MRRQECRKSTAEQLCTLKHMVGPNGAWPLSSSPPSKNTLRTFVFAVSTGRTTTSLNVKMTTMVVVYDVTVLR